MLLVWDVDCGVSCAYGHVFMQCVGFWRRPSILIRVDTERYCTASYMRPPWCETVNQCVRSGFGSGSSPIDGFISCEPRAKVQGYLPARKPSTGIACAGDTDVESQNMLFPRLRSKLEILLPPVPIYYFFCYVPKYILCLNT